MHHIYNYSNAFRRLTKRIPPHLNNYKLVVIHYVNDDFKCDRWTTRSRDIQKNHSKMLQFDVCHAYLFEPSRFVQFIDNINKNKKTFSFLAYRLSGDKWISTVDLFDTKIVSMVEYSIVGNSYE